MNIRTFLSIAPLAALLLHACDSAPTSGEQRDQLAKQRSTSSANPAHVFTRQYQKKGKGTYALSVMDEDGGNVTDLFTNTDAFPRQMRPSFSPDARSIVYSTHASQSAPWSIEAADIDVSSGKPVATNVRTIAPGTGSGSTAAWGFINATFSPSRSEVAVTKADQSESAVSIWLADPSGASQPVRIYTIPDAHNVSHIRWSPTGDSLMVLERWTETDADGRNWSASQLRLLARPSSPGSGDATSLGTYFYGRNDIGYFDWSHHNGRILVTRGSGGIQMFNINDATPTLAALISSGADPVWEPTDNGFRYHAGSGTVYYYSFASGSASTAISGSYGPSDWERRPQN